jgi:hypothetical protein
MFLSIRSLVYSRYARAKFCCTRVRLRHPFIFFVAWLFSLVNSARSARCAWFPGVTKAYKERPVAPAVIESSARLHDLIHNGKLELSLADALSLALETIWILRCSGRIPA